MTSKKSCKIFVIMYLLWIYCCYQDGVGWLVYSFGLLVTLVWSSVVLGVDGASCFCSFVYRFLEFKGAIHMFKVIKRLEM